jgi:hypothetical protein
MTEKVGQGYPTHSLYSLFGECNEDDIILILFQLIYSIHVMGKFRLMHNDMHIANILVVEYPVERKMSFTVANRTFLIRTKYIPYIFDWDNAYVEKLGPNPNIYNDSKYGVSNKFSDKSDLFMLFCKMKTKDLDKYPKLKKYLKSSYYTYLFNKEQSDDKNRLKVSQKDILEIQKYEPYYKNKKINVYKMSILQIKYLIPDIIEKNPKFTTKAGTIMFSLSKNYLEVNEGVGCSVTSFDSNYPTPLEMLTFTGEWTSNTKAFDIFEKYEIKEDPHLLGIKHNNIFKEPKDKLPPHKIYIDPLLKSTRSKIIGKPYFSEQIKSGYVKTLSKKQIDKVDNISEIEHLLQFL